MKIRNERGEASALLVSFIALAILFVVTASFAAWAFVSRQDYKNNSDQKVAAAVEVAKKNTAAQKDNEYLEKEKYPLKSYTGPGDLGALRIVYPKTWSAYINTGTENQFIFNPDIVNAASEALYALKVSIVPQSYNNSVQQFEGRVQAGAASAKAYSLPKVPSVVGLRFDGEIEPGKPGALVILPLRDKTIEIFCEVPDNLSDFNKIVLPNISFNP
ncbi:MAG TPA: hypothetical protein VFW77_01010 [Candidatus Saccharimonadales bacterium]|nr:hypothetical protein [Candidatus Saccharimonadales bacterium]